MRWPWSNHTIPEDARIVDAFEAAIVERPETFEQNTYTLKDNVTSVEYWVSNDRYGMWRPARYYFSRESAKRFEVAYKKWQIMLTIAAQQNVDRTTPVQEVEPPAAIKGGLTEGKR